MSCFCEQNEEKLSMQCEGDPKCLMTGLGYYHQTPDDQIHYFCSRCRDILKLFHNRSCHNLSSFGKISRIFWVNCDCDDHAHGVSSCDECMKKKCSSLIMTDECIKRNQERKVIVTEALESIKTDSYQTFGNLKDLVLDYLQF